MMPAVSGADAPKLKLIPVFRMVWRMYREHWWMLVPASLVVLLPQALGDAVLGDIHIERLRTPSDLLKLAEVPLAVVINLGGEALFAGIVAAAAVEWLRGRTLRDLPGAIRRIKLGRLIVLDLILALGTAVGLALLVLPGVAFYTYLAVAPALIEINQVKVGEAIRSSVRMVRGNFIRVLWFTILVLVLSEVAFTAIEAPLHGVQGNLIFNLAIEAVIEPFQALTTVFLAFALLDLHGLDDRVAAFNRRAKAGV